MGRLEGISVGAWLAALSAAGVGSTYAGRTYREHTPTSKAKKPRPFKGSKAAKKSSRRRRP